MGKKVAWLLLACLLVISGCSSESSNSTESSSSSKQEDKPKDTKESTKTESTAQKESSQQSPSNISDPKKAYLATVYKEMKHLDEAKIIIQNQLNAYYKQDKEIAKTQAWKDEIGRGYSMVESIHTNLKTYPQDKIPPEVKDHHALLVEGLSFMAKSKTFIMRGFPQNAEDVSTSGVGFLKYGNNTIDLALERISNTY
ncbi:hypothetical protein QRY07_12075 [Bacillus cereus]|uniref:hypothetical protein n=1 Tax=Bacillus cereus TaxID=1396 RepID=UPI002570193A|nr:hypothetical protein [Bacillus cereus]WJE22422.1 hypothetical protein QRY07_12075 [Bacillus cereus]